MDRDAKAGQTLKRTPAVRACGKIAYHRLTLSDPSDHCQPVADRLIAGNKSLPSQYQSRRELHGIHVVQISMRIDFENTSCYLEGNVVE